jgi:hypothetical protein
MIGNDLLYRAWTDRDPVHVIYIYVTCKLYIRTTDTADCDSGKQLRKGYLLALLFVCCESEKGP